MKKNQPKFCGDCANFYQFPDGINGCCTVKLPSWADPYPGAIMNADGQWMMAANTGAGACRCFSKKEADNG